MNLLRAEVIDNDDSALSPSPPRGRVKVRIPSIHPEGDVKDENLPWASPSFLMLTPSPDYGAAIFPPAVGSWVWVGFEDGDLRSPVWLGYCFPPNESINRYSRNEGFPEVVLLTNQANTIRIIIQEQVLRLELKDTGGEIQHLIELDIEQKENLIRSLEGTTQLQLGEGDSMIRMEFDADEGNIQLQGKELRCILEELIISGEKITLRGDEIRLTGDEVTCGAREVSGFIRRGGTG